MQKTLEIKFTHPRNASLFTAEVSLQCTGQEAIEGLLVGDGQEPFLETPPSGRSYLLIIRRTQEQIPPNMTFAEAGIVNGDVIDILQAGQGAGLDWTELGEMLFWSATAASIFLKAAVPALIEFLKNKGSRSVIVQKGEEKRIFTGYNADEIVNILKVLENPSTNNMQSGNVERQLESPISVTILDSEGKDSAEN